MKNEDRPEMNPVGKGDALKVLEVRARAGMAMPMHHATEEAVIVVKSGKSVLKMEDQEYELNTGDTMILPAMKDHSLTIVEGFKAIVTMPVAARIEF